MKKQRPFGNALLAAIIGVTLLAVAAQAQVQWAKRIASTTNTDNEFSVGVTLDNNGNCYVTGWFDGTNDFGGVTLTNLSGGGQDIFLAKYNSIGALQWARRAGGNSTNQDVGRGVGVDTNGNVYVTGGFYGPADFGTSNLSGSSTEVFFLAKYDSNGTVQWVQPSGAGPKLYGTGLAVGGAGNCYAIGFANGGASVVFGPTNLPNPSAHGYSTLLVKYDNTGALKWGQLIGGPGQTYATKVAVDAGGNVYVNGSFTENITIGTSNLVAAGSTENAFFARFDTLGNLIWVQQPQGDVGKQSGGGVSVDQNGNVYVTGAFNTTSLTFGPLSLTNAGLSDEAFVAKYDRSGAIQWARPTRGTNFDGYWDIALDAQTNVYTAGVLSSEAAVAKYSLTGTSQWGYSASGLPASPVSSLVQKCAVDSTGNSYLAGWYHGTTTFGTNVLQPQSYWNFFLAKVAAPSPLTLGIALSNGTPRLSLAGSIGSIYSLQWSPIVAPTNTSWQTLTTLALTNSPQFYIDTSAPPGTNRFYRAGPPAL